MALTNINSEDSLVRQTFADHLQDVLGKDSVYAWHQKNWQLFDNGGESLLLEERADP